MSFPGTVQIELDEFERLHGLAAENAVLRHERDTLALKVAGLTEEHDALTIQHEAMIQVSVASLQAKLKASGITLCAYCGTTLVAVRGAHPEDRPRQVCPCCLQELVDRIHRDTSPAHGACEAEGQEHYE